MLNGEDGKLNDKNLSKNEWLDRQYSKFEIIFKRYKNGKSYCKYEVLKTKFRNYSSLVQLTDDICECNENAAMCIRRSKSSTVITCHIGNGISCSSYSNNSNSDSNVSGKLSNNRKNYIDTGTDNINKDLDRNTKVNLDNLSRTSIETKNNILTKCGNNNSHKFENLQSNGIDDNNDYDKEIIVNSVNNSNLTNKSRKGRNTNPFLEHELCYHDEFNDMECKENELLEVQQQHQQCNQNNINYAGAMEGKTEITDKILHLNETQMVAKEPISMCHTDSNGDEENEILSNDDDDDNDNNDDDDELSKSEWNNQPSTDRMEIGPLESNANSSINHKSYTSLHINDLDRKTKQRHRKHRTKDWESRSGDNNIVVAVDNGNNNRKLIGHQRHTNSKSIRSFHQPDAKMANEDNYKNEKLDKFINEFNRRLMNHSRSGTSSTTTGTRSTSISQSYQSIMDIGGIPTCPFYRQDYIKPDDDDVDISESADVNRTTSSKKTKRDLFGFSLQKDKSSNRVPHLKKLNINYPNKTTFLSDDPQPKEEKKLLKRSLLKIGQKCGIKIIKSPEKRTLTVPVVDPVNEYGAEKRENFVSNLQQQSIVDIIDDVQCDDAIQTEKAAYKSYKSEIDLTKNLHYLDAFLNENFDRIANTHGSHSIGKISNKKKRHQGHQYHKRARSCTKNINYTKDCANIDINIDTDTDAMQINDGFSIEDEVSTKIVCSNYYHADSAKESNYSKNLSNVQLIPSQRNVNSTILPHQRTISSSDSFSTYNSKKSKVTKSIKNEMIFNNTSDLFNGDKSGRSNTTSSSLSSSDYASVYSPSGSGYVPSDTHNYDTKDQHTDYFNNKQIEVSPKRGQYKKRCDKNQYTDDILIPRSKYNENDFDQPHSLDHYHHSAIEHQLPKNSDLSVYQYENKIPYHEDYLQHYLKTTMTPSIGSRETIRYHHNTISSTIKNGSFYPSATVTIAPQAPSHASSNHTYPHRVIVSKSKKQTGEVVLEYEC